MLEKRTDLALEVHELRGEESGIAVSEADISGITVTTAVISPGEGERLSGKRAGKYITLDVGKLWQYDSERFNRITEILSDELKKLLPKGDACVLAAGLGNLEITSDSLGPRAVRSLLVTRHIKSLDPTLYENAGFGCLAAIASGVLSQTGVESAEIIKSVCDNVKPKCVILIDALASRRLSRLATTVQLSDSGISPGSGVSNKRQALDRDFLGVPVISLGVPTVVDAATLAYDIFEEHGGVADEAFADTVKKILQGDGKNMFVTPKENDVMIKTSAKLISSAINLAVHNIAISEINEYIGN